MWQRVAPRWKPSLRSTTGTTLLSGESVSTFRNLFFEGGDFVACVTFTICHACPLCSFLYDHQSPAHRFYKEKVEQFRQSKVDRSSPATAEVPETVVQRPAAPPLSVAPPPPPPSVRYSYVPSQTDSPLLTPKTESSPPPVKRKRKSRWGSEDDKVELPIPLSAIKQEADAPDPNMPSLSGTGISISYTSITTLYSTTTLHKYSGY